MTSTNAIESWIETTLLGDTAVAAIVGDRVYLDYAPTSQETYPYIIFQNQTADEVGGVGSARIMADTIYIVKGVTQGPFTALDSLVTAINGALISSTGGTTAYGDVFTCHHEKPFRLALNEAGKTYRYLGSEFRVHAQP